MVFCDIPICEDDALPVTSPFSCCPFCPPTSKLIIQYYPLYTEVVRLCGLSGGLVIARSQVQCPVLSVAVAVAVVSLSKELDCHCSSQPSCING